MQLLDLHMQFFGPYRDETVDFASFAATPLFLISGKTGSGKTTIFDALVFALYGDTSGDDRSGDEMRANFASPEDRTRVTLRFTHGGKTYEIWREPAQVVAKQHGSGTTSKPMALALTVFEDGQEVGQWTKKRDVAPRIEDLLHLDADQFRQIVILPQGKFRQFLDANSDDKGALLQHLFGTGLYARWQASLKAKAKTQHDAVAKQADRLTTLASQFTYADAVPAADASLPDQLTAMTASINAQTAQRDAAATALHQAQAAYTAANQAYQEGDRLQRAFAQQATAKNALAALDEAAPALAAKQAQAIKLQWVQAHVAEADRLTQAQAALTALTAKIATTTKALADAQAQLDAATAAQAELKAQAAEVATKQTRLTQLATLRPQLERVAALTQQQATAEQTNTKAQGRVSTATTALAQAQAALAKTTAAQAALTTADQTAAREAAAQALAALTPVYRQWTTVAAELKLATATLTARQPAAAAAQATADEKQARYVKLHDAQLAGQIAGLAAQLSPNAPCPVCGSLTHPHPASATAATVTTEAVDGADQARQQAASAAVAAQAAVTQAAAEVQRLTSQQAALAKQISPDGAVEATYAAAQKRVAELTAAVAAAMKQQTQLAQQAATEQAAVDAAQTTLTQAQVAAHAAETAAASAQSALATAQAALPAAAPTLATLTSEQAGLEQAVATFTAAQTSTQAKLTAAKETLAERRATLASQQAQRTASEATLTTDQARFAAAQTEALGQETDFATWQQQLPTLASLTAALAEAKTQRDQQTALLAQAEAQIRQQTPPDLPALQAARTETETAQATAQTTAVTAAQTLARNQELAATIARDFAANQQALEQAISLDSLAQVISGTNPRKLSLERFVLRAYLAQVLKVANPRLQKLTNGRYQFALHNEPGSYRNDSGLEIDVYDDQVGQARSVHTLSGGESFIAALSLALALGEVIQEEAGGVSIDALFVDEGFGSLDTASLNTAMEALESIEGQARMIGIISHVAELQESVPDQLQVVPTGTGQSHLRAVHADR